jgi:hypothetical protein
MRHHRHWLIVLAVLLLAAPAGAQGPKLTKATAHIVAATTTTVVAGASGVIIGIWSASICVDAGGAQTSVTIQDSAGTNLVGPNVVYVLPAGSCWWAPLRSVQYPFNTGAGRGVQIVTSGAGPTEVLLEVSK